MTNFILVIIKNETGSVGAINSFSEQQKKICMTTA
jgi:hypothetical protein